MKLIDENFEVPRRVFVMYLAVGTCAALCVNLFARLLQTPFTALLGLATIVVCLFTHYFAREGSGFRRRMRVRMSLGAAWMLSVASCGSAFPIPLGTDGQLFPAGELVVAGLLGGLGGYLLVIVCGLCADALFRRTRGFVSEGACAHCGYPLAGLISGRCPECGGAYPEPKDRSAALRKDAGEAS